MTKTKPFLRLKGWEAVEYVRQLGASVGLNKYNDPVEAQRFNISIDDAEEVARQDPNLIYFDANPDDPDHETILNRVSELLHG